MDIEKIIQLIDKVSEAPITSLNIEEGSLKISIEKNNGVMQTVTAPAQVVPALRPMSVPAAELPQASIQEVQSAPKEDFKEITSPLVGIFYAAASPEAEPFAKAGDIVKKGDVVGIVEAMKLMNEIESEVDGEIAEVLVKNGEAVEFGQPLFRVK